MQAAGFEWLFRLALEPRRLFWRYAVTNPVAIYLLLTRTSSVQTAQ
jgi:UDP-N-acetyl-D-mannosaminuronic acid transferase (WecB/TagA/CpsF family)